MNIVRVERNISRFRRKRNSDAQKQPAGQRMQNASPGGLLIQKKEKDYRPSSLPSFTFKAV